MDLLNETLAACEFNPKILTPKLRSCRQLLVKVGNALFRPHKETQQQACRNKYLGRSRFFPLESTGEDSVSSAAAPSAESTFQLKTHS